jgi:acyl-[acyl-carrier-protein]-phospholipid O-acyltransferase/long-chain-fatty-acid--[acyl-carrier-protein] ligase
MHAGWLADRFSKRKVLLAAKTAEVAVMGICALGFFLSEEFSFILVYLLVGLCLLGVQATYYSPAKFGILPEILPEKLISWGNGIFEMTGTLAIILGSIVGAELLRVLDGKLFLAPLLFLCAAALGVVATWFLPHVPPAAPRSPPRINPVRALIEHGGKLVRHRVLRLTLIAVVFIWSLGVLFQLNMAMYAKANLGFREWDVSLPMVFVALGIAGGTIGAGYLSGKTIEIGLVPISVMGLSLAAAGLYLTSASAALTFAVVAALGMFAGLSIVPTHALLQEESPQEDTGAVWAATNFLQTLGMLLAAATFALLKGVVGLSAPTIFLIGGAGTLLLAVAFFALLPEALGRTAAYLRLGLFRRVLVQGQDHVPAHGPVLFLLDGSPRTDFCMLLAGTRRFVRFVIPSSVSDGRLLACVCRKLRSIRFSDDPSGASQLEALAEAEAALARGETVGLFADGWSAAGVAIPEEAVADLLDRVSAPVLPVGISREGDRRILSFHRPWGREASARELLARHCKRS